MASAIRQQALLHVRDTQASVLLGTALECAHSQVELCMFALEAIMAQSTLEDAAQFSTVRMRLVQENLARTAVARDACAHLISRGGGFQVEALRELQQREFQHFQLISAHICEWTPTAVQEDWRGYCRATRRVLNRVRDLVAAERALLLPALS
jgi:hypothetical protein